MGDGLILFFADAAHAGAEAHAEPAVAGVLTATVWVSLSMLVLIGIMVWKKVPAMVAGMLDARIATIRGQLAEAATLRAEAEALRGEYQARLAALDSEAADMRARAEQEAKTIVDSAKQDVKALIGRRQKMAEDRIAAAERAAIADVRASVARSAAAAAEQLIRKDHDAASDRALVDQAISGIDRL